MGMLRMSLDSPYSVFTSKKEFVTALESDLKLLGEVHVASEPSSAGTTVSISFKKASEKLRAKQVTTLRAVMKKIMKHSLNFNKLSAELKGTVAVKAVGVTQDPTLVPVKLSPVKAPPSKEVLTSPFLEKLKRLDKEAKDEEESHGSRVESGGERSVEGKRRRREQGDTSRA